jgi:hypothetical protein
MAEVTAKHKQILIQLAQHREEKVVWLGGMNQHSSLASLHLLTDTVR